MKTRCQNTFCALSSALLALSVTSCGSSGGSDAGPSDIVEDAISPVSGNTSSSVDFSSLPSLTQEFSDDELSQAYFDITLFFNRVLEYKVFDAGLDWSRDYSLHVFPSDMRFTKPGDTTAIDSSDVMCADSGSYQHIGLDGTSGYQEGARFFDECWLNSSLLDGNFIIDADPEAETLAVVAEQYVVAYYRESDGLLRESKTYDGSFFVKFESNDGAYTLTQTSDGFTESLVEGNPTFLTHNLNFSQYERVIYVDDNSKNVAFNMVGTADFNRVLARDGDYDFTVETLIPMGVKDGEGQGEMKITLNDRFYAISQFRDNFMQIDIDMDRDGDFDAQYIVVYSVGLMTQ